MFSPEKYVKYLPNKNNLSFLSSLQPIWQPFETEVFWNYSLSKKHFCIQTKNALEVRNYFLKRRRPTPTLKGSKGTLTHSPEKDWVPTDCKYKMFTRFWPCGGIFVFVPNMQSISKTLENTATSNGCHLSYKHARRLRFVLFGLYCTYFSGEKTKLKGCSSMMLM